MTDIVERLRNRAHCEEALGLYTQAQLLEEAADEIERLWTGQKPGERAAQGTPADEQSGETGPHRAISPEEWIRLSEVDRLKKEMEVYDILEDDHERGCEGRTYSCTCSYDKRVADEIKRQRAALIRIANSTGCIDDVEQLRRIALGALGHPVELKPYD